MFDCIPDKLATQRSIISKIKDTHIIFFCCICKRKITTYWDNFCTLKGDFVSMELDESELFNSVNNANKIVCEKCFYNE